MACIIKMSSDAFLNKFIKKYDYKKFNFLLISEDIKTNSHYKNVYPIPVLIPPPNIINTYISQGFTTKYAKRYIDYIQTPRVEAMITIMVKLAIIDNSNVVLLCSKNEEEYQYTDLICQYIENIYGITTYSYKEYKKNPAKCEKISDKDKKKVSKILEKKLKNIKDINQPISKKEVEEMFDEMDKEDIVEYLRNHSVEANKKDSRKDLIKKVIKLYRR